MDSARIALTRERLEEAVGARGVVHRKAHTYRRAVAEALLGLGEQRYGTLIDLLIKIRAPQLSKRPNKRASMGGRRSSTSYSDTDRRLA